MGITLVFVVFVVFVMTLLANIRASSAFAGYIALHTFLRDTEEGRH